MTRKVVALKGRNIHVIERKTCRNYKSITSSCTLKGVCDLYPPFKWYICTGPEENIPLVEPSPPPPPHPGEVLHIPIPGGSEQKECPFQVSGLYERVGISVFEVYERVARSFGL